jgi:hypothetical protein
LTKNTFRFLGVKKVRHCGIMVESGKVCRGGLHEGRDVEAFVRMERRGVHESIYYKAALCLRVMRGRDWWGSQGHLQAQFQIIESFYSSLGG